MKSENSNEQLVNKLRQLPIIEDHRNKDELFQRISTQITEKKQQKNYRLAPIISLSLVAVVIFAMLPMFMNLGMDGNSMSDSVDNADIQSSGDYSVKTNHEDENSGVQESSLDIQDMNSYVVQDTQNFTVIYGAVSDNQLQTVIPITILTSNTADLNTQYNHLDEYLKTNDWGLNDYLFKHANFEIDLDDRHVTIHLPNDFTIGEGSANSSMFEKILAKMFMPYEIEKVFFEEKIDLGHIGEVTELPIYDSDKNNYKIFQAEEHDRKFLVPLPVDENATIEQAILDMKKGNRSSHIYPTIPEEIQFSFSTANEELIITLTNDYAFEDDQDLVTMIESILMTAKSYGYKQVNFNEMSIDQVGPYRLSESIAVPDAINPIYR